MDISDYVKTVIKKGDKGSKLLAGICTPTLRNKPEFVQILEEGMNGVVVLKNLSDYVVAVHSAAGDPKERDLERHTASMVERLMYQAINIGARPIAFADVIDSNTGDISLIKLVGNTLVREANSFGISILNGENAVLGRRINPKYQANISGTMISIIPREGFNFLNPINYKQGSYYAYFLPEDKAVYINSDGIGTATEFGERAGVFHRELRSALAMKLDDTIKLGADAKVVCDVVETRGNIPFHKIWEYKKELAKELGIDYILQRENVGDRLIGYKDGAPVFNVSGSAVSTLDENRLRNPLKPVTEDYVIAVRGNPNRRSNGITLRRDIMNYLGTLWNDKSEEFKEWHKTKQGKMFLEYLIEPSTILYPVFKDLINNDLASSVYHMSGGAYNGKLARPLAKHGKYASLKNMFKPHEIDLYMIGAKGIPIRDAYQSWPLGNDGFITTNNPEEAIALINKHGLEARVVGKIENATPTRQGVRIEAYNGKTLYYSGRD